MPEKRGPTFKSRGFAELAMPSRGGEGNLQQDYRDGRAYFSSKDGKWGLRPTTWRLSIGSSKKPQ